MFKKIYSLHVIKQNTINQIQNMTRDEFHSWVKNQNLIKQEQDLHHFKPQQLTTGEYRYHIGSKFEEAKPFLSKNTPLFKQPELQELFTYMSITPQIIKKEDLKHIIQQQINQIVQQYDELLNSNDPHISREEQLASHICKMKDQWLNRVDNYGVTHAINIDPNNPILTYSSVQEFSIFELTRIYKTMNWDQHSLIIMGWSG